MKRESRQTELFRRTLRLMAFETRQCFAHKRSLSVVRHDHESLALLWTIERDTVKPFSRAASSRARLPFGFRFNKSDPVVGQNAFGPGSLQAPFAPPFESSGGESYVIARIKTWSSNVLTRHYQTVSRFQSKLHPR